MVIIDTGMRGWCHLAASTITELHEFAKRIGVKRCWFENKRGRNQPHYDLRIHMIDVALRHGARQVCKKALYNFLYEQYAITNQSFNQEH